MIKVGHELSDAEIEYRYSVLAHALRLPEYFYPAVAEFASAASAKVILDIGCGGGELLRAIRSRVPAAYCMGLEISGGRLKAAQAMLGPQVGLIQITANEPFPLASHSVDVILITEVLEHLKDPLPFLAEVRRVLRPGGHIVLTTPNSAAYPAWPLFGWLGQHQRLYPLVRHFLPFEHPLKTVQPIDTVFSLVEVSAILAAADLRPLRTCGREALPFLFVLPGWRGLAHRMRWIQPMIDRLFNRVGAQAGCYRVFWDLVPTR